MYFPLWHQHECYRENPKFMHQSEYIIATLNRKGNSLGRIAVSSRLVYYPLSGILFSLLSLQWRPEHPPVRHASCSHYPNRCAHSLLPPPPPQSIHIRLSLPTTQQASQRSNNTQPSLNAASGRGMPCGASHAQCMYKECDTLHSVVYNNAMHGTRHALPKRVV